VLVNNAGTLVTTGRPSPTGTRRAPDCGHTAIESELAPDGVGAFLAWGDPSLYDSTLRILERVGADVDIDYDVIPGITVADFPFGWAGGGVDSDFGFSEFAVDVARPAFRRLADVVGGVAEGFLDAVAILLVLRQDCDVCVGDAGHFATLLRLRIRFLGFFHVGTVNLRSCGHSANHISLIRHTRPGESRRRTGENRPRIAQVDSARTTVLLIEFVLPNHNREFPGKLADLEMLVNLSARKRTASEYRRLLEQAGFAMTRVLHTAGPFSLVQAKAA
jgi:Tetrapyrrole (Corrin/Porphyrin) Methylases/O-methyltransferase domain